MYVNPKTSNVSGLPNSDVVNTCSTGQQVESKQKTTAREMTKFYTERTKLRCNIVGKKKSEVAI